MQFRHVHLMLPYANSACSPIFFLYDNFNQARRVRHQTKDHQASFLSGTTATVVVGEDIGEELSSMEKVPNTLVVDIKLTEDDTKHFKVVYRHHLFKALQPTLNKGPLFKALAIPPIKVLISRPTEAYELAAMEIDQSTVSGNMAVLEEMRRVLDLDKELFKEMKMILAGDHLSVSRLRALMSRKSDDTTFFDRLSWAIPVLQLFHMQMLLCTSILRTHFGGDGLKPGSLRYYKVMLDRKGLDDEKPSHHLADEFLRTVFTAMARRMWQTKQVCSYFSPINYGSSFLDLGANFFVRFSRRAVLSIQKHHQTTFFSLKSTTWWTESFSSQNIYTTVTPL